MGTSSPWLCSSFDCIECWGDLKVLDIYTVLWELKPKDWIMKAVNSCVAKCHGNIFQTNKYCHSTSISMRSVFTDGTAVQFLKYLLFFIQNVQIIISKLYQFKFLDFHNTFFLRQFYIFKHGELNINSFKYIVLYFSTM